MKPSLLVNKEFFEEIDGEIMLVGSKCVKCEKVYFPRKKFCIECMSDELKIVPLSKRGKIVCWTVARQTYTYGIPLPYAFGYVDLPEGVRLFTIFTDCEPFEEKLKTGGEVEWVIKSFKEDEMGNDIIGYLFRPVEVKK